MNRITAILQADSDGTLHLPVPAELRRGKVQVTAMIERVGATPEAIALRKAALKKLREAGGLREAISDPAAWQREVRSDRPLPGRP